MGAAFKGVLLQDFATETVNGADARLVKALQGPSQATLDGGVILLLESQRGDDRVVEEVAWGVVGALEGQQGLAKPRADSLPQLGGGGLGVGDHEDAVDRDVVALGDEAQHDVGDAVGLAGPRAGLQQLDAHGKGGAGGEVS